MQSPSEMKKAKSRSWIYGSALSLLLLAVVLMQTDVATITGLLRSAAWPALAAAFLCLTGEGFFTALRIRLFTGKKICRSDALRANAWYVLLLVLLPARLGEIAAVEVFRRLLGQTYGAAAMSIVAQRLYDVAVLGAFFLAALAGLGGMKISGIAWLAAFVAMVAAVLFLRHLIFFLTLGAVILRRGGRGVSRKILRLILQARTWDRHIMRRGVFIPALFFTTMKWVCNLGALVFLFASVHLGLGFFEATAMAAAYNFLAIIPVQTVGGIGAGDAGLTLLLIAAGLDKNIAAGASILVRLAIIVFPFLFWLMVAGGLRLKEKIHA